MLYRIISSYFVAGLVTEEQIVGFLERREIIIKAAPILNWMVGRSTIYLFDYSKKKNWIVEELK